MESCINKKGLTLIKELLKECKLCITNLATMDKFNNSSLYKKYCYL